MGRKKKDGSTWLERRKEMAEKRKEEKQERKRMEMLEKKNKKEAKKLEKEAMKAALLEQRKQWKEQKKRRRAEEAIDKSTRLNRVELDFYEHRPPEATHQITVYMLESKTVEADASLLYSPMFKEGMHVNLEITMRRGAQISRIRGEWMKEKKTTPYLEEAMTICLIADDGFLCIPEFSLKYTPNTQRTIEIKVSTAEKRIVLESNPCVFTTYFGKLPESLLVPCTVPVRVEKVTNCLIALPLFKKTA